MYKTRKEVIEDIKIGDKSPKAKHIFTGRESTLQLPFTISFSNTGDYVVHIDKDMVVAEKIK